MRSQSETRSNQSSDEPETEWYKGTFKDELEKLKESGGERDNSFIAGEDQTSGYEVLMDAGLVFIDVVYKPQDHASLGIDLHPRLVQSTGAILAGFRPVIDGRSSSVKMGVAERDGKVRVGDLLVFANGGMGGVTTGL